MVSGKISCTVHCLDPETVRAAKTAMKGAATGKVSFVCKVSDKKENILLLSDESAWRLTSLPDALGGPLAQKILYALAGAELCECDIATLSERSEHEVLDELARLRSAGMLTCRKIASMTYYALGSAEIATALEERLCALETP